MTDRYAVMGDPIAHSKSPDIHQQFAQQTQQAISYEKILVPADIFQQAVKTFIAQGGKGLNITLPLKQLAFDFVDQLNPRAKLAQAVNTIIIQTDGTTIGDNTDGIGLCRDLITNHHVDLNKQKILLLGAGGAARGVIGPLLEHNVADIHIANRTESKAIEMAEVFSALGKVTASGFDALDQRQFDIIINATSASVADKVPAIPSELYAKANCCYDMFYSDKPTSFMQVALDAGCSQVFDGRGMLLEQAAESFYLWRGVRPHSDGVVI